MEPWRFFKGNVRLLVDPEEMRQSQKETEKQWIVRLSLSVLPLIPSFSYLPLLLFDHHFVSKLP